jgi:hypothetical protein
MLQVYRSALYFEWSDGFTLTTTWGKKTSDKNMGEKEKEGTIKNQTKRGKDNKKLKQKRMKKRKTNIKRQ